MIRASIGSSLLTLKAYRFIDEQFKFRLLFNWSNSNGNEFFHSRGGSKKIDHFTHMGKHFDHLLFPWISSYRPKKGSHSSISQQQQICVLCRRCCSFMNQHEKRVLWKLSGQVKIKEQRELNEYVRFNETESLLVTPIQCVYYGHEIPVSIFDCFIEEWNLNMIFPIVIYIWAHEWGRMIEDVFFSSFPLLRTNTE